MSGKNGPPHERRTGLVLDFSVAVLIDPGNESRFLPVLEPLRRMLVGDSFEAVHHVVAGKGGHGRGGGVQNRDEKQGPAGAQTGVTNRRNRVETHDHVGQSGRSHHEREGNAQHVEHGGALCGECGRILRESQVLGDHV